MKASELRELGVEELNKKAAELRRELMLARFAKINQQLKNPLKLRALRREIARILTVVREKTPRLASSNAKELARGKKEAK